MLVALTLGHLTYGDMTNYVGFLPLTMLGYGLMRRRDTPFLAMLAVAFVLLWFALGGNFSVACYNYFPLMNKFRQISYAFNILKVFVLLLGGFGFDQWLRDVRGLGSNHGDAVGKWGRLGIALLLVGFAADFVYSVRPNDLTDCWLNYCDKSFAQGPWTRYGLMGRYLCYTGVFAGTLLAVIPRVHRKLLGLMGTALFAVYVADVGSFYLAMVKYTRFVSNTVEVGDAFHVCPLVYGEQRIRFDAKAPPPGRARDIINILKDAGGEFPPSNSTLYASLYLLFRVDPINPTYRIDLVTPGIKRMIESAGGALPANHGRPGIYLPNSDRFKQSLGFGMPKIRIVRAAKIVSNDAIILDESLASARPQTVPGDDIHVTKFSANRVEIDVVADTPGWLYDADAFDRGWKAAIEGQPAQVFSANAGCKAVFVQKGSQHVVFYFDRGLRDWMCSGVIYSAAFSGFVLLGGVVVIGLRERDGRGDGETKNAPAATSLLALRIWSACAIAASLSLCPLPGARHDRLKNDCSKPQGEVFRTLEVKEWGSRGQPIISFISRTARSMPTSTARATML